MIMRLLGLSTIISSTAFAETAGAATSSGNMAGAVGALALGIAAFGGALGQGKAASAAFDGMARNPQAKLFVPMMIGLALIESLVIYALVVALKLAG